MSSSNVFFHFYFTKTPSTDIYTLSLHDALPISNTPRSRHCASSDSGEKMSGMYSSLSRPTPCSPESLDARSEEHTSELQSHVNLVCRLLLEKKKQMNLFRCVHRYFIV